MTYKILQLNKGHKDQLFMPYRHNGDKVRKSWYNEVYSGEIEDKGNIFTTLERLFYIFNMEHPSDFEGHSLSISDVVYLDGKYYYCDTFGFKELTNFED